MIKEIKNKKGGNKIMAVYWFVILLIVAGAVAYMASAVYGDPYDVREIEANLLVNKIADCFAEGGQLTDKVFDGKNFLINNDNFLGICKVNFNDDEFNEYYIEANILDFNSKANLLSEPISFGNSNLKDFCEIKSKKNPFCVERSFYTLDKFRTGNQYLVNVLSIVRKTEKNIK